MSAIESPAIAWCEAMLAQKAAGSAAYLHAKGCAACTTGEEPCAVGRDLDLAHWAAIGRADDAEAAYLKAKGEQVK